MYLGNVVGLVMVLTTVPVFAAILRVPFAAIAPMIVVSCAIGAYAIQNAMFDIWLMLVFGVVGYVFKKIGIPLAPFTLALVLGSRAEDAFRLSMIGAEGDLRVFWSNWLVGSITTLALVLLFWPVIGAGFEWMRGLFRAKVRFRCLFPEIELIASTRWLHLSMGEVDTHGAATASIQNDHGLKRAAPQAAAFTYLSNHSSVCRQASLAAASSYRGVVSLWNP